MKVGLSFENLFPSDFTKQQPNSSQFRKLMLENEVYNNKNVFEKHLKNLQMHKIIITILLGLFFPQFTYKFDENL